MPATKNDWIQRAAVLQPATGLYIDGGFRTARNGETFPTVSPRDGSVTAHVSAAGEQDGYVEEELGECLLALGRESQARPHFAAAYGLLRSDIWLARDEPARLARLRDLGGVPPDSSGP